MKNIALIALTVILTITITSFSYSSRNNLVANKLSCQKAEKIEAPVFFYNLSSLGQNTITKEMIYNARTVSDLIPDYRIQEDLKNQILSVRDVTIRIEEENEQHTKFRSERGNGNNLSQEQISLLKAMDYSTNFFLEGATTHNSSKIDLPKELYFNYYMTVVPEQQAIYKAGNEAFINFLSSKCQPIIEKVPSENLKNGRISFTVTKAGAISNIDLNSSCGYPSIDEKMVELMNDLPDGWNAATNEKGEQVNQTLVFLYGQTGC